MLVMHWQGQGIARISSAIQKTSSRKLHTALRRGVNHVGDKTFTVVKRSLAKQVGLPQAKVVRFGGLKRYRANYQTLDYVIASRGQFISLRHFNPRQQKAGTAAKPWGRRELFEHAFMGARPGVISTKLRGHVFVRKSGARLPIRRLYGPSIPREMMQRETAAAFQATVSASLASRIEHEIKVLTDGVVS